MAGPAAVVVAGTFTAAIAFTTFDGQVADDYYRQGLAVNRELTRESAARALGVSAQVQFSEDHRRVRVLLEGPESGSLRLALLHPTLPAEDQSIVLVASGPGVYDGAMRPPPGKRVRLALQDGEGRWRVTGEWLTKQGATRLAPR